MKTIDLKRQEIIQFIMQVKDESLLDNIKSLFEPTQTSTKDWWDSLSVGDQKEIELSISESDQGQTVTHKVVNQKIDRLVNAKR